MLAKSEDLIIKIAELDEELWGRISDLHDSLGQLTDFVNEVEKRAAASC